MDQFEKGDRVVLKDNVSQIFCGYIKSINESMGRMVLRDIILLPSQKPINGYRNFESVEIAEIKKCEAEKPDSGDAAQKTEEEEPIKPVIQLSHSESEKIKKNQNEYRYIKNCDSNYYHAISLLKNCSKIGVYGEDASKGRFGRISVIAVSTPSNIFLFDVQVLGDDILHKGLKEILESPNIIKVVYDCRLLSDCLKHKHLISLENVRDIEAEDVMVVFQERKVVRRHSRTLEYLTRVYLGLELEVCGEPKEAWTERPVPKNLVEGLVSRVSVMLTLQEKVEGQYLQRLIGASNIYNNHLRSLDFFDALNEEPRRTLRNKIIKLLVPQTQTRANYKSKKVS